jgi:uncharacterized protein (TIGR03382 family)
MNHLPSLPALLLTPLFGGCDTASAGGWETLLWLALLGLAWLAVRRLAA